MAQFGSTQHWADGRRLFEHTSIASEKAEREVYRSSYKRFKRMGLDQLDKKFDNKFRVDSFNPEDELEDDPEVIPAEDLEASQNMHQRALKRAYGQEIIERIERHDRVSDKQRAFLVKDFIENNGASSVANLFLKMHGFRSWKDLFDQAGVTQEEVQGHYGFDDSGNPVVGFGDVDINEDVERSFLQKHGSKIVKGAILTGATVATGGAGFLAVAGGMVGGALGRRATRYFTHDRFVKGKHKAKGEQEDLAQISRGMEMVTGIIDDYVVVRDEVIAKMQENREARMAQQQEETADSKREHYAFPKEVMDLEEGKNLLGLAMKGFAEKARENISKNDKVGQYWAHEKISKRWEMLGGIVGGVIGGGAGAALNAKLESYRLMDQIQHGSGVSLDLDGDKIEHTVRLMQNPASGHMDYMWQMGSQDVARVGHESISGWTHTFFPGGEVVQGGTFNAAALQALSPDQITVHATALNIPESVLMEKLFMTALMSNAATIGSVTAAAILLDNVHYKVTGMETTKNRDIATKAVGRFAEYANQRRRARRQEKLDEQLTPRTEEELRNERLEREKAEKEAADAEAEAKRKEEEEAEQQRLKEEETAEQKRIADEKQALLKKISDFEKLHGKNDASKGKRDFQAIDQATVGWNHFHSAEGKVVLVDVERVGMDWNTFKTKVISLLHSEMTATNRLSFVVAIDGGDRGLFEIAAQDPSFNPADRDFQDKVLADLDAAIKASPAGHPRGYIDGIDKFNVINRGYAATSPSPDLASWKGYLEDVATRDGIADVASKVFIEPTITP